MKILIITTPGLGFIRMWGLAKYIRNFGWEITIITTSGWESTIINEKDFEDFQDIRIIETPYEDLITKWKKFFGLKEELAVKTQIYKEKKENRIVNLLLLIWYEIFAYPDAQKNWLKIALDKSDELIIKEKFDIILSSSPPPTAHIIANKLKEKHQIPWVADFRDLWTQNHYEKHTIFRNFFERRLEKKTIKNADAIITVSGVLAEKLKILHNRKNVNIIYNGFDQEIKKNKTKLTNKFSITYTGKLYSGKRNPELLFRALNDLIIENKINKYDLSLKFYGDSNYMLRYLLETYNLDDVAEIHQMIPRKEVIDIQRESQLLLMLKWDNPGEIGIIPSKFFEYLSVRRPILSIGNKNSVIEDLIISTNSGVHIYDYDQMKNQLARYYQEYKSKGYVIYNGIDVEINKYTQENMAKEFSYIFKKITDN